jgi:hypothetical protein
LEGAVVMQLFGLPVPAYLAGPFLLSGDSVYIGRSCLPEAIEFCAANDLVILGMEGVTTDGSAVVPAMDFIADLGEIDGDWGERVRSSQAEAQQIAQGWASLSGFEFVELVVAAQGN